MAKKTKDSNLSLEERLEQALIPNWDEPYKLPSNWCWVRVDAVASIYTGNSINERVKEEKYTGLTEGLVYLATKDIDFDSTINYETNVRIPDADRFKVAPKFSTLLCIEGGSAGRKIGYITQDVCFVNKLCAFVPHAKINPKYLYYTIQSDAFKKQFDAKKHGLIGGVSIKEVSSIYIPLAPVEQQAQIVELIESIFYKFNEASEKAQEVVDGFETRKAAILHKAFSGELTEKWRTANNIGFDTWVQFDLQSVCSAKITDGTHKTPVYSDSLNGIPFLSSKDVTSEKINWDNIKYIDAKLHEELYARLAPQKGDVLLAKNGTTGVAALVEEDKVFDLYVTLAVLRPNKNIINSKYLHRIVNSPMCKKQFNEHLTGIGVPNLHLRDIKKVTIYVPTLLEQETIVNILETLIEKEQRVKENCEAVVDQIDAMKKAILARAFRGELGTNDPSKESAIVLVKSILSRATKSTTDRSNSNTHYLSTQKSNQTRYRVRGSGLGRTRSSIVGSKGMAMSRQTIGKALFAIPGVHQWKPNTNARVVAGVRPIKTPVKKQIVSRGKTVHEREILKVLCESVETPVHIGKLITVGSKWTDKMDAIRSLEKSGVIVRIGKDKFKIK